MSYDVFSMSPYSRKVGTIRPNGDVIGSDGSRAGKISSDGKIVTADGRTLGTVTREGKIRGEIVDSDIKMDLKGYVFKNGQRIGAVKQKEKGVPEMLAQWAAFALLISPGMESKESAANSTIVASPEKIKMMIRAAKIAAFKRSQELQTIKQKSPFK